MATEKNVPLITLTFNKKSVETINTLAKLVGKKPAMFNYVNSKVTVFSAPSNIYMIDDLGVTVSGANPSVSFTIPDVSTFANFVGDGAIVAVSDKGVAIKRNKSNFKLPIATDGVVEVLNDAVKLKDRIVVEVEEKCKITMKPETISEIKDVYGSIVQNAGSAIVQFDFNSNVTVSIIDGTNNMSEVGELVSKIDITTDGHKSTGEHLTFKGYLNSTIGNFVSDDDTYSFKTSKDGNLSIIENVTCGVRILTALI